MGIRVKGKHSFNQLFILLDILEEEQVKIFEKYKYSREIGNVCGWGIVVSMNSKLEWQMSKKCQENFNKRNMQNLDFFHCFSNLPIQFEIAICWKKCHFIYLNI